MKLLVLITAVIAVAHCQNYYHFNEQQLEYERNAALSLNEHLNPLITRLALEANYYTKEHFIISAHNIWYTLASLVDENKMTDQEELFALLNLPDDKDRRKQFYNHSLLLQKPAGFSIGTVLAIDETVPFEKDWYNVVFSNPKAFGIPPHLHSPIFDKPFGKVQKYVVPNEDFPFSSHSVLVSLLDYYGEVNSTFFDRTVQPGPFYNGQESPATAEYLRMKGRVRVAEYPEFRVLEIPLQPHGRRSMLFAVGDKPSTIIEAFFDKDIFSDLKLTEEPIEIIVPRLVLSSGMDFGSIFRNMKRSSVFSDPADSSRSKLDPATPMGYFQIVSYDIYDNVYTFKDLGLPEEEIDFSALEKDSFVVNKPFLFALFGLYPNTEVRVPLFAGVYSHAGEQGQQRVFD